MAKSKYSIPCPTESAEQASLLLWANLAASRMPELNLLFAIPNGGWRTPATAARLKREGVKAGVPDLMLPVARGKYHGLCLELKRRKGGHIDPAQLRWAKELTAQGYFHCFCSGWHEAKAVLESYLDGKMIKQ